MFMKKHAEFLRRKQLEYSVSLKRQVKDKEYANYLGVSATTYSGWVNNGYIPSDANLALLANKFGDEIYDVCDLPRPSPRIDVGYLPERYRQQLSAFVADVSSLLSGVDPESSDAESIIHSLMDKHGINFISKSKSHPGIEK